MYRFWFALFGMKKNYDGFNFNDLQGNVDSGLGLLTERVKTLIPYQITVSSCP